MSIFLKGLEAVSNGNTFFIDFQNRSMKIGKHKLIDNGEYGSSQPLYDNEVGNYDSWIQTIDELYYNYRYSLPSERNSRRWVRYFKALPANELTDEQLICGERREVAQYKLEAFILCLILDGVFIWDEDKYGKWFYQSSENPELVILRRWIENK